MPKKYHQLILVKQHDDAWRSVSCANTAYGHLFINILSRTFLYDVICFLITYKENTFIHYNRNLLKNWLSNRIFQTIVPTQEWPFYFYVFDIFLFSSKHYTIEKCSNSRIMVRVESDNECVTKNNILLFTLKRHFQGKLLQEM